MSFPELLFYFFAAAAVLSSAAVVGALRNTPLAALGLAISMLSLAGIYVLLEAHLVAVLVMVVHAGSIAMIFLFVVVFYDARRGALPSGRQRALRVGGALLCIAMLDRGLRRLEPLGDAPPSPPGFGGYRQAGLALYTDYVLLLELSGLLLGAAIVGGLFLARRRVG